LEVVETAAAVVAVVGAVAALVGAVMAAAVVKEKEELELRRWCR
jgi:hypothetical protein